MTHTFSTVSFYREKRRHNWKRLSVRERAGRQEGEDVRRGLSGTLSRRVASWSVEDP